MMVPETKIWTDLAQAFIKSSDSMNSQDVANSAWGFSRQPRLLESQPSLLPSLKRSIYDRLTILNHHEIISIYHSISILKAETNSEEIDEAFIEKIERRIMDIIKYLDIASISIAAYSLTKRGSFSNTLWDKIELTLLRKTGMQNPKNIDNVASLACNLYKGPGS